MKYREEFKLAFIATLPVLAGYLMLGAGFGVLFVSAGFDVFWAPIIALGMYSGSMQYIAVELYASAASYLNIAIATLLVNGRHLFYGLSLLKKYEGCEIKQKAYMIYALTDETYSLVCQSKIDEHHNAHKYYFYVSLLDHIYWVSGCTLGAILGTMLPFSTEGIEFVLTALFVTIFVDQWISTRNHVSAITGVLTTIVCVLVFGKDNFLIPSIIAIIMVLAIIEKIRRR